MRIRTKLTSILLVISLLIITACPLALSETIEDNQSGFWFNMNNGIAVRIVDNGSSTVNAFVGDKFSVQFWIYGIDPQSVSIPLKWDTNIVRVVDKSTGKPVTSGRKSEANVNENGGFAPGVHCYDMATDDNYIPLYWNGKPLYSARYKENTRGYPYLNAETGLYQFFYFVLSPTKSTIPQMFLEVDFEAIAKGDPNFHFATPADGTTTEDFDAASPEGMKLGFPLELGEDAEIDNTKENIEVYTDKVVFPDFRIITPEDMHQELPDNLTILHPSTSPTPVPDSANGTKNSGSSGTSGGTSTRRTTPRPTVTPEPTPELVEATLTSAQRLDLWPYSAPPIECSAVVNEKQGATLYVSDGHILPSGNLSAAINETSEKPYAKAVLVRMPEQIIKANEYKIRLYCSNMSDMVLTGLYMLYIETPYGLVGLNPSVIMSNAASTSSLTLTVKPTDSGIRADMEIEGELHNSFREPMYRFILPRTAEGVLVPSTANAFGDGYEGENPLSVNKYYADKNAFVFLSQAGGELKISERTPVSFTDLKDAAWAEEQINKLSQIGIISGMGDGTFAPNAQVTREQFAVMITKTFSTYQSHLRTAFTDVDRDSVYYPYIASANMMGIISGISDTEFGGAAPITRQDLAVLVYRAYDLLGIQLPMTEKAGAFADDSEIADYAKTAVYALTQAGIINGVGENKFDPRGTASRAATARILGSIYPYIQDLV